MRPNIGIFIAIALFGLWLRAPNINPVGRGLWCFFLSGTMVWLFGRTPQSRRTILAIYAATLVTAAMILFEVSRLTPTWLAATDNARYVLYTLLFSLIVLSLVVSDKKLTAVSAPLSWLGDISYSSYMVHFPLQLTFMLGTVATYGHYTADPFGSPLMVTVFFGTLLALSLAVFHWFEIPMRDKLRKSGDLDHTKRQHADNRIF